MIRVLVTGASGFIGSSLIKHLSSLGMEVAGSSRSSRSSSTLLELSPESESFDRVLFSQFDVVVHCAARVHQMRKHDQDESLFYRDNVLFSRRVAEACLSAGVSHFIFFSSIKVVGESTSLLPFCAQSIPNPQDAYGRSKWMAEQTLIECVRGKEMSLSIVRIPLVYGSGAKGNLAMLERFAAKGVPMPFGGIQNRRSLLGLRNLCEFISYLISHGGEKGRSEMFLLADSRPVSTPEVYTYLGKRHGKTLYLPSLPTVFWRSLEQIPQLQQIVNRLTSDLEIDISDTVRSTGWTPRYAALTD